MFVSHFPVARQVAVIIPSGNSPSSHWKTTRVPGIAGTECSLMVPFRGGGSEAVQFIGGETVYNEELTQNKYYPYSKSLTHEL